MTPPPVDIAALDCDAITIVPTADANGQAHNKTGAAINTIGDYRILKEIARGGMGVVYLAEHQQLARRVALKTLLVGGNEDSSATKRFAIEAEAVARLDHPGIVTIYDVGEHEGEPYLAMKFIAGGSLAKLLQQGPIDIDRALRIGIEAADAIAHAHQRAVIHRDLKPANILLHLDGSAVITDFGVAKCVETVRCQLTSAGEPIGTPHYMPPEQADASRGVIGPWSDVYSLGAVIYAMLTGRPPFQAANSIDVILQVLANDPVPPSRLNATVPATLEAIVMKCLQKDAKHRYQSAGELAEDLRNFRDGKPTVAKPIRGLRWTAYQLRKHFMVATVSGSIVTLLLLSSVIIVIAYVNLLHHKVELESEKADLADVLQSERALYRARISGLRNENISEAEFAADRLASYATYVQKENPELAARLAVESLRLYQRVGQTPDQPLWSYWLRTLRSIHRMIPHHCSSRHMKSRRRLPQSKSRLTFNCPPISEFFSGLNRLMPNHQLR